MFIYIPLNCESCDILESEGYSLQANIKELQFYIGKFDRDVQFKHISDLTNKFIENNNPVISIDTKKKETLGNFKNNGTEYEKSPVKVFDRDFKLGGFTTAVPHGIYDIKRNSGFVTFGISSDTAEFAIESIFRWYELMGKEFYKDSNEILITCDGGGSNGHRVKAWKYYVQELANKINKTITICHFPPGTSKWNKIEHKLFSFISKNWRGKPLIDVATIVNLIGNTTTSKGLIVKCVLDNNTYKTGFKVSDEDYEKISIKRHETIPELNYTISPKL